MNQWKKHYFSIISVNISGLIKSKEEVNVIINRMKPEVVCLCETHTADDISDYEIAFENYNMIRTNTNNKRTGGVITYVMKNIKFKVVFNSNVMIDGSWLNCIQLNIGDFKLYLCNIYRSPNSSVNVFCDKFIELIEQIVDKGKILVVGDFNIDMLRNNFYARKLNDEMSNLGMKQYINTPTRITATSQTIIDLVFSNFWIKHTVMTTPKISDHSMLLLGVDGLKNYDKNTIIYTRDFKGVNDEALITKIYKKFNNWENEFCSENDNIDLDVVTDRINNYLFDILDDVAPLTKKVVSGKWINKPWINGNIIDMIKKKDKLYKVAIKTKSIIDMNKHKVIRNRVVDLIRVSKQEYYEFNVVNNKNDSRKMWKTLKELIGDKKNSNSIKEIQFGKKVESDSCIIANKLNNYFIDSINNIVKEINCDDDSNDSFIDEISVNNAVWDTFDKVSCLGLEKIINNLDSNKGSKKGINSSLVKLIWKAKCDLIMYMINTSLELGRVPCN